MSFRVSWHGVGHERIGVRGVGSRPLTSITGAAMKTSSEQASLGATAQLLQL